MEYVAKKIVSIKPVGVKRVVNLTVDNNHTFLCSNGIVTHNCERLSTGAQESLKGIIESVSKNCVFILTTNNINRIVQPLVSRCRRIDFVWKKEEIPELKKAMVRRITHILNMENIPFDIRAVAAVVNRYFPDNRQTLGILQDYAQQEGKIDMKVVNNLGVEGIEDLIATLKAKDFKAMSQWCMDNVDQVGPDFYGKMFRFLYPDSRVNETLQRRVTDESVPYLVDLLGEEQKWHSQVPDPYVHLCRTFTLLMVDPNIRFL